MALPNQPQNKYEGKPESCRSGNFFYLFAGLLLMLLTVPYVHCLPVVGRYSLTLMFNAFMLIAVWSLSGTRSFFYIGFSLALAISFISGGSIFGFTNQALEIAGLFLMLIFAGISAWIAGRHVFVLHRVDFNSLVGAFCVYLLLGFIWAILFRLLQLLGLATFSGLISTDKPFPQLIYFSYAFSDPNDLLSYSIPKGFADKYLDSRLCPTITNININITNVIKAFGISDFANPVEAHVAYDQDDRVIKLIARGIGTQGSAPLVQQKCEFIKINQ
ncbi:MAG: hypothetical protein KJ725_17480 [Gammaproteobacteria bacterium]|nr:hypothetical protein [Gammaproteobacteria bacterium]